MNIDKKQAVHALLSQFKSVEPLKQLIWSELGYDRADAPLSRRKLGEPIAQTLAEDPLLFATGGEDDQFHILYARLAGDRLLLGPERALVGRLLREHPYGLFVFSNETQDCWHFLNVKEGPDAASRRLFRRITIEPNGYFRTVAERIAMLDLEGLENQSPLAIQKRHDEAFDVQAVTKKFYKELANWYFWAREHAVFPKDAQPDAEGKPSLHLIRLLTRLIFCWFLRQKRNPKTGKGLIPDDLFDPSKIKELLKDPSEKSCTYYTAILQNLFFATLNTEMDKPGEPPNRRFLDEGDGKLSDDHMVHTVWRHAGQLRDPETLARLLRDIPFLNGGLFECLDDRVQKGDSAYTEEIRIDGFSNFPHKQPKLPNFLFFGPERTEDLSGAYGDAAHRREAVRPLLSILNAYNFTLTENTPLDQEVALDPELLGHVFENLLATYNPETGKIARKATGSFYTPRVAVDWMVDKALLIYLSAALGGTEEVNQPRLKRLLSWEEIGHDFSPAEIEILIDAIDRLKALDPACGSGAFPMGLLQKLVHLLRKLDPENKGWRRRQEARIEAMESAPMREAALAGIERAFAHDNDDYGRKLHLIYNSLYGVDIQPIACQIAKLRFFISLIVDQTIDPSLPNYGILPLPNLETKIVAANTLMGLKRGQLRLGAEKVKSLEEDLRRVRHEYFTARSYRRKKDLRNQDHELCRALAAALAEGGEYTPSDSKRLAGWNPYDTTKEASFFDPEWMFGLPPVQRDGNFDILIGNPPYVRQEDLKSVTVTGHQGKPIPLKDALKEQYECFTGTADLYVYFFERALQLLRTGGTLSFITSNKYFRAAYGERLRAYLLYATRPSVALDFGDAPVFTSIAYPCILVTQKVRHLSKGDLPSPSEPTGVLHPSKLPPKDWTSRVFTWPPEKSLDDFPFLFEERSQAIAQRELKPDGWRLESPVGLRMLERLRKAGTPVGEYVKGRFYRGILTGLNEAFVVDRATRDSLIAEHPSSKEILKPFLRGRDVKRWRCEFAEQYLIKIESSENKQHPWSDKSDKEAERVFAKTYPAIHDFFKPLRKKLVERYDQGKYFWELRSCDYWQEFEKPKILYQEIATYQVFAWDDSRAYTNNKTFLIPEESMYLLALLNSKICWWFLGQVASKLQGGAYALQMPYMEQFPIPSANSGQQSACERLVEAIIYLHGPEAAKMEIVGAHGCAPGFRMAHGDAPDMINDQQHRPGAHGRAPLQGDDRNGMIAFFDRWLNGLVYELFFPDDLHAKKLNLFDVSAKLKMPNLEKIPSVKKPQAILDLYGACRDKSLIPAMLDDLQKIEPIRIIEGLQA